MKHIKKKNSHLAQLAEHWFEWIANQMDVGSNPTVRGMERNGMERKWAQSPELII